MNEDLVLAITMLIILAVVVLFIQISQQIKVKRIQKMKIQRRFGEIPDGGSTSDREDQCLS